MTKAMSSFGNFGSIFPSVRRLEDTPKQRRLQFIKTRYCKPRCMCQALAHYQDVVNRRYWCRSCLPTVLRKRLSMEWQLSQVVFPLSIYMERS